MPTPNHRRSFSEPLAARQRGRPLPLPIALTATLTDPSITLTCTLAVSAIRKGNATPATPRISCVSASHTGVLRGATIFSFWVVFSILRIPRADSQSRRDTREPRLRNTPSGCPTLLALWRPFRPTGRTSPAIKTHRTPGDGGQFGRRCLTSRRGEQIIASASVPATLSRGHASVRTLRDGLPTIVRPMEIAMRKPPLLLHEGGGSI
jgi:hypothetical protein